nr:hypothetical protein [Vibrio parahaemolyticus]
MGVEVPCSCLVIASFAP